MRKENMKYLSTSQNITALSRRQFMKRSTAAASALAVPYFIPATALGRGGAVAPSERIVMGAIGNGGRGTADLHSMLGEPDVARGTPAICVALTLPPAAKVLVPIAVLTVPSVAVPDTSDNVPPLALPLTIRPPFVPAVALGNADKPP